jgi:hypothetical protein
MSRPTRGTPAGQAYLDLQNRARAEGRGTQELLTLYVVERWLARLSASPYVDQFVLKGGMLLAAFDARRPTADADALARDFANDEATVVGRVVAIADQPVPDDGVEFRTGTVTSRVIRDEDLYSGVRIAMDCAIATAIVKLRLDINFGDPVTHRNSSIFPRCALASRRSESLATRSRRSWQRRSRPPSCSVRRTPACATTPMSTHSQGAVRCYTPRPAGRCSPRRAIGERRRWRCPGPSGRRCPRRRVLAWRSWVVGSAGVVAHRCSGVGEQCLAVACHHGSGGLWEAGDVDAELVWLARRGPRRSLIRHAQ